MQPLVSPHSSVATFQLREYQEILITDARAAMRSGYRRPLLCLPTGGGKTIVAARIIAGAIERGKRVVFLAHRKELIDQASEKLEDCGIDHGIIMANHWRRKPYAPVQVASIATLVNRELANAPDLIFIDEAHRARAASYEDILNNYPAAFAIGLTATPIRSDGKGLGNLFDTLIQGPSVASLMEQGYLVPARVYAPAKPDLEGVKTTAGDYNQGGLQRVMDKPMLTGDIVAHWQRLGEDRQTVCFAAGIEHSRHIVERFRAVGIAAEHVDGTTDKDERERILADLEAGRVRVVSNYGVLTEGWDCPVCACLINARPTKNEGLYLQMCLDSETEILTRDGWKNCHTFSAADVVAAFDKSTSKINWEVPTSVIRRPMAEGERYCSVDSPHLNIRVTGQHSMVYRTATRTAKNWHIRTAEDLAKLRVHFRLPVSGYQDAAGVPLRDCEISFLGWFLSDGTLSKANNAICISQAENSPSINTIEQCLKDCGFKYGRHVSIRQGKLAGYPAIVQFTVSKGKPRGRDSHLSGWERIGRFIDKEIADSLFEMDQRQVGLLLAAINLGDGHKGKCAWTPRTMRISTGNRRYADRLQALCVVSGYRCNVSTYSYNKSPLYVLGISKKESAMVGGQLAERGRSRLVFSPGDGETVWCVETQSGAIVTRRNGKVAIVGNCGRILRPAPGKVDALILDHAGCTLEHGLVDEERHWTLDVDRKRMAGPKLNLRLPRVCPDCFRVCGLNDTACPCGYVFSSRNGSGPVQVDGDLQEVTEGRGRRDFSRIPMERRKEMYMRWVSEAVANGWKPSAPWAKYYAMFKTPPEAEWMLEVSAEMRPIIAARDRKPGELIRL